MRDDQDLTPEAARTLRQASGLLASDPARAGGLARAALATAPDNPDALIILGTALRLAGAPADAAAVMAPLVARGGGGWIAPFELARTRLALGESGAAVAPLAAALARNPALAAGWRLLGEIALVSGDFAAARRAWDRQLVAVCREPALAAAAGALAAGRDEEAERLARPALTGGARAAALHITGEAAARSGRLAEAQRLLAAGVKAAPDADLARQAYAAVLLGAGKPATALAELDILLGHDPADVRARAGKSAALTELGDHAGATAFTAAIAEQFPDQPQGWLVHAVGLRTLGRTEEAAAAWRRCLALAPASSEAWWGLASLTTRRLGRADAVAIATALAAPDLAAEDEPRLRYALGRSAEAAGRFDAAFAAYRQGGAIERQRRGYDPRRMTEFVGQARHLFNGAFFAKGQGGEPSPAPVFIVGLPRSGSSLVDQILASHPAIEGVGELGEIQAIADWTALRSPAARTLGYPQALADLPAAERTRLGASYLGWAAARRRLGRPRFTDKAPGNFRHVGLIRLILPGAKVIDVRRHPLGCCVSAFRQYFAGGWDFSFDLGDLGRYYADYVALMAHFDAALPGVVHRVIYEDLVADTEGETRRLLAFLDLPFDPACLRFFDNPRAVATPSSEQVRQPIFAEATNAWRDFEPWLDPLKAALGPALEGWRR